MLIFQILNKQVFTYIISLIIGLNNIFSQELELNIKLKDSTMNPFFKSLNLKKKHLNLKELDKYLDSVSQNLKIRGFFYNRINSTKKTNTHYNIYWDLGQKTDSIELSFESNTFFKNLDLKSKKKINISSLPFFLQNLSAQLEKKGRPFSKITLQEIKQENKIISAKIKLTTSVKRKIDKIIVKGYENFPKKFLYHFFKIKNNSTYNKKIINEISKNLNSINFVKQIKQPQVLFSKDSTILYLYLKKNKVNTFDGILNLSSSEQDGTLFFNGNINLHLNNILNSGEELKLSWNANGNEKQNLNLLFKIPFIFNSPISTKTTLNIHKQDSSFSNSKLTNSLLYKINPKTDIGVTLQSENSTTLSSKNTELNIDFSSLSYGVNITYSTPKEHIIFKNKLNITVEYLIRNRKTLLNTQRQNKIHLEASYLIDINKRNYIYLRNESAFLNSKDYFQNELYRIGGANSLRGFDQESILASNYSYINTEYRYLTSSKSYLYSILDIALITPLKSPQQKVAGYGLGYFFKRKNSSFNLALTSNYSPNKTTNKLNISISYINFF